MQNAFYAFAQLVSIPLIPLSTFESVASMNDCIISIVLRFIIIFFLIKTKPEVQHIQVSEKFCYDYSVPEIKFADELRESVCAEVNYFNHGAILLGFYF